MIYSKFRSIAACVAAMAMACMIASPAFADPPGPVQLYSSSSAAPGYAPISSGNPLPISGTFSATLAPFSPTANTLTGSPIGVTTSSSSPVNLGAEGPVLLYNSGSNTVYYAFGGSGVAATTTSLPIPAGACENVSTGTLGQYIAAITATSTSTLYAYPGTGLAALSCGGSGGGSGGNSNITQINGTTALANTGATGAGSLRVTTAQDTATIAGSAPGTAGAASAQVVSVQGIAGGTAQPVSGSVTVTQGTASNLNAAVVGIGTAGSPSGGVVSTQGVGSCTNAVSTALAANQVVKGSAGNLCSFEVAADSTLSSAAWWVMIYNATSAPSDGSVTPAKCYALPSGSTTMTGAFQVPLAFGTGITIGVSTTGCFTKTASTHALIAGDFQ